LTRRWAAASRRDEVVEFVRKWADKTGLAIEQLLQGLELSAGKFYNWCQRQGQPNQHNDKVPRHFWLEDWERQAILEYQALYPEVGYRRLSYMMIDADVVAVSPSSVFRVLKQADRLSRSPSGTSTKGTGFQQPQKAHEHWHVDFSYINIHGTFYYLCAVLDGASRYILAWDLKESMTSADVEITLQRALELFPGHSPRVISDNGPQFIAKDFKEFIRISGMSHVRTSPYHPQSNGKLERWNGSIKSECIRPQVPLSLDEARRLIAQYVQVYNEQRLHSSLQYVTPKDWLEERQEVVLAARQQKLAAASLRRRQAVRTTVTAPLQETAA